MEIRLVIFAVALLIYVAVAQEKYTTKFDYLNLEMILRNNRLVKSYYKCLVDLGPCTQEGYELRKVLPDALKTRCRKCSALQKKNGKKVVEYLINNKPDIWTGLMRKYDPKGTLAKDILSDPKFLG